jgi:hypothetical protein
MLYGAAPAETSAKIREKNSLFCSRDPQLGDEYVVAQSGKRCLARCSKWAEGAVYQSEGDALVAIGCFFTGGTSYSDGDIYC